MSSKEIACNSQANVVATTKVTWNIAGWEGPFQNLVRSQASCFVSLEESPKETVDLRFYLRYVENHNDPANDAESPLCKSRAKFSGYSLMMDVLSDHKETLMVSVIVKTSEEDKYSFEPKKGVVVVDPNSVKSGITAIKLFRRCELWDEDENGSVRNYELLDSEPYDLNVPTWDRKYLLTVSSYKMENIGPDNPNLNQGHTEEVPQLAQDLQAFQFEPENYSDLVLKSEDDMVIRAHRFILAARSPYFNRLLKNGATSLSLDVLAKPLLALLHWIYTGEIQNNCGRYLGSIIGAAVKFEMPSFLKTLDGKLITLANTENMFMLAELAKKYGIQKAADDMAKFVKNNISSWLRNPCPDTNLEDVDKFDNPKILMETANTNPAVRGHQNNQLEIQEKIPPSSSSSNNAENLSKEEDKETLIQKIEADGGLDMSTIEEVESPKADKNWSAKSNSELENEIKRGEEIYNAMLEVVKLNEIVQKLFKKCNAEPEFNSSLKQDFLNARRDMKNFSTTLSKIFFEK